MPAGSEEAGSLQSRMAGSESGSEYSETDSGHPRDSLKVRQVEVKTTSLAAPGGQHLQVWHLPKTQEAVGPREKGQEGSEQRGGKTPILLETRRGRPLVDNRPSID